MLEDFELNRLFKLFLKEETLSENYFCTKCKKPQKSSKRFVIWKLPNILVIHFKRFSFSTYRKEKLNSNVIFPVDTIDLKEFVTESSFI